VATDLFKLFDGRSGDRIARNNELIWAFSMVKANCGWSLRVWVELKGVSKPEFMWNERVSQCLVWLLWYQSKAK